MKVLLGKEVVKLISPNFNEHKIILEGDKDYKETKVEPAISCLFEKEELSKVIKFIRDVGILGVDNSAVNLMRKLKEEIINKTEERRTDKIINAK